MSQRSQRKEEHLALAKMFFNKEIPSDFDYIHLIRPALPESSYQTKSINTRLFGKTIAAPIYINAMTGGSQTSLRINKTLGQAAAKANIPLALGSASILEKEPDQLQSFYVARQENPDGLLFANVNPNTSSQSVKTIVRDLNADALQIHLNTVQEAAMPEGDRNFFWLDNLKEIRNSIDIPIIIKEVGQGLDKDTITILQKEGFEYFDLGGSGGTDFAKIENSRRPHHELSFLEDINLSTPKALLWLQAAHDFPKQLFASGGIRNSLDIFKCLVLGANFVGMASHFLEFAYRGTDELTKEIENIKDQLVMLTALFGLSDISQAKKVKYYLDNNLYIFSKQIN
ncbi:type 2 isopentenyl-diphosphate Delta-isomerase [Lactobacillus sp. PV034]|uniref:type 2 isopentenyl-diphosphate Delta-isomerase n=1 Tax=Lactobacillus sp. PV034 TaxID=2594495 RepID=UPI00223F4113|nr:type 2 isopentenyl-diphosphate Delta-isomerase [Lactobacillus sp. PV034]QNQ80401.1 type 2 isopentenyl-diphosphate Delta-isomerase [Lactobacillus sp. PV034]